MLGQAPIWLAFVLMLGLVGIMGLYHAALGYLLRPLAAAAGALRWLVALPAAWLLMEWWRGWFLSGFSWLSLGYSQTDTWLAGFAPLVGVYGISALLLVCAGALVTLALGSRGERLAALVGAACCRGRAGAALYRHSWTHESGAPVSVAVMQGAIPQDEKWLESNRDTDAQPLPVPHREGARHAADRVAGVRARRSRQRPRRATSPTSTARRTRTVPRS